MENWQDICTPKVNSTYGAPMGRCGDNNPEGRRAFVNCTRRVYCRKLPLDSGGYDKGGAYWGQRLNGESLYCVYDQYGALDYIDAKNRAAAIALYFESHGNPAKRKAA